ncbi:MAG: hypothetical protein ACLF0G_18085 [Candidatus Brocadiia bacterium]
MAEDQGSGPARREFLKGAAAAGAGLAAMAAGEGAAAEPATEPAMPTLRLGPHRVSRLVLGSNPILGYSHVSRLMSRLMTDYFSLANVQSLLVRCLEVGINTWQTSAHEKVDRSLATLRESGRDIQWVFLASHPHIDEPKALEEVVRRNKPVAVVHHGGVSDRLWREGKIEKARDFAKRVRDMGLLAGLSAHNPAVIRHAEDRGWGLDLYMTCFYQVTRSAEALREDFGFRDVPLGEVYLSGDPGRMCEVVRAVERPCLGFKILAAGRRCRGPRDVDGAFQFAFRNIKPGDGVIVGMFPRFRDQAGENAQRARRFGATGG